MDISKFYKLKSRFVSRKVGNETVVVPLVNNVAQMNKLYNFNETAGFLWENLREDSTLESLKSELMANFEVEETQAEQDIKAFLEKLETLSDV